MTSVVKYINDPLAPPRLQGKKVTIIRDRETRKLRFEVEVPDDHTPNEAAYLRLRIEEYVDELRKKYPFIGTEPHWETRG